MFFCNLYIIMNNLENQNISYQFKTATSSTPNNFAPIRRRPIHPEVSPSPIKATSVSREETTTSTPEKEKIYRSTSELPKRNSESECSVSDFEDDDTTQSNSHSSSYFSNSSLNRKPNSKISVSSEERKELFVGNVIIGCIIIVILLAGGLLSLVFPSTSESAEPLHYDNKITIRDLRSNFPLQSEELWNALYSGIQEVKNLNKPSVFLFLYEDEAEDTVNKILSDASKYAECILNQDCEIQPIILTSGNLNSEKAITDYGYVINKYKSELERKSVMIVKDLDKVLGQVAQAFHSMCDEYTPLVEKTVFFFTMKVDNLRSILKSNVHIAEDILRSNWSNLDDSIFEPLFTRISSIVLRVVPENT